MEKGNLIERATSFAADKHKEHFRKEGGLLYISHLVGVALILARFDFADKVIASGLLHDTLEDTETSREEILENFGLEILNIISSVTYDDKLNWKDARLKYIETVKNSNENVKAVSLADKLHNMESLLYALQEKGDIIWSNFTTDKHTKIWFEEECLKMFKETWDHPMVTDYENLLLNLKTKYFQN